MALPTTLLPEKFGELVKKQDGPSVDTKVIEIDDGAKKSNNENDTITKIDTATESETQAPVDTTQAPVDDTGDSTTELVGSDTETPVDDAETPVDDAETHVVTLNGAEYNVADLGYLSSKSLRDLCRACGVETKGKKQVLIDRLVEHGQAE